MDDLQYKEIVKEVYDHLKVLASVSVFLIAILHLYYNAGVEIITRAGDTLTEDISLLNIVIWYLLYPASILWSLFWFSALHKYRINKQIMFALKVSTLANYLLLSLFIVVVVCQDFFFRYGLLKIFIGLTLGTLVLNSFLFAIAIFVLCFLVYFKLKKIND